MQPLPPPPPPQPQAVAERHFPYPLAGCGFLRPDGCALVPVVRDSVAGGVRLRLFAAAAAAGRLPELVQVRPGCLACGAGARTSRVLANAVRCGRGGLTVLVLLGAVTYA